MNRLLALFAGMLALLVLVEPLQAQQALLHERASPYNTVIVTEEEGLRTLRFERGGARQSVVKPGDPDHLELPYLRAAFASLALCPEPKRIMVVGLGGASIPMFLRLHYPGAEIDAVDIDPEVVSVAKEFFGFREDGRMRAVVGDGRAFVEQSKPPYDLIFLDAYGSSSVPAHLTTREFLQAVRRIVAPGGVVVGNLWSRYSNPLYDSMVRTYQEVFDDLYILDVKDAGNRILLALPRKQSLSRGELAEMATQISTTKKLRYDLGELVRIGFHHATERDPDARVLTDERPGNKD